MPRVNGYAPGFGEAPDGSGMSSMNQEREIRRDLRMDETPYPAITTMKTMTSASWEGGRVPGCLQTRHAPSAANTRKKKPRIWCQRECTGFTAAGTTVLRKRPDCRANWPCCRADGIQRRTRRPATRPSCCGLATPQCYQTRRGSTLSPLSNSALVQYCSKGLCSVQSRGLAVQLTRQPMALNLHLYKRVAPEERGRTWKSV
jgi:hypothetical protein